MVLKCNNESGLLAKGFHTDLLKEDGSLLIPIGVIQSTLRNVWRTSILLVDTVSTMITGVPPDTGVTTDTRVYTDTRVHAKPRVLGFLRDWVV